LSLSWFPWILFSELIISLILEFKIPCSLLKYKETSAMFKRFFLSEPEKITSSLFLLRKSLVLCSPKAHLIESAIFDFPDPLGPTTTVIPLFLSAKRPEKTSLFLLANDLNPCNSNFSKYIF